jgi:hypothetical protein
MHINALLLSALAGSAVAARVHHAHERRHAAAKIDNIDKVIEEVVEVDKRGVGDWVTAEIDGVLVSWINEWSGQQTTTQEPAPAPTEASSTTTTTSSTTSMISLHAPAPTSSGDTTWFAAPQSGEFSRDGFGGSTSAQGNSDSIEYQGNVGIPWGSNIILVTEQTANQYQHVLRFEGSNTDAWTVIFWNKMGPNGKMDGWYGNSALKFTMEPNEVKYVAIDSNSQGAWGAAQGENLPTDQFGGYACTWGEFDMSNEGNGGQSGWDVSAIQAQAANLFVQGMQICTHEGTLCSSIANELASVVNAYTYSERYVDGLGGTIKANAIRLVVNLDFA